jgi:signal transduction histidine kinase
MGPTISQVILLDRHIAYAVTDRDLRVVEACGDVAVLQCSGQTCLGRSLIEVVPELLGYERELEAILGGELERWQIDLVNRPGPDGDTVYLTMVTLPRRDRAGGVIGLIHLVDDVTEVGALHQRVSQSRNELTGLRDQLARQNLELAAANGELRQLDEMKSMFVSVAAHELRSPLATMKAFLELLAEEDTGPLNEEQREFLDILQGSARRLLVITSNLLDATRIESGRVDLLLQECDLAALVERVASEMGPTVTGRAQRLTLRIEPGLPRALCDETRAAQVLTNLVSNASKYTQEGGLIEVSVARSAEDGFLQISVADDGVGIPAEDQDRLYDRFFRAGTATATGATGAGLGLSITRSLVELHGGRIWFESELNVGSTFHVTFPTAEAPPTPSD